jgi:hypothetical protein
MYVSGNITTYASRIHEFQTGQNDLTLFITEGRGYLTTPFTTVSGVYKSGVMPQTSGQWEQELRYQKFRLLGDPLSLIQQQL